MRALIVSMALVLAWSCGGKTVVDGGGGGTTTSSGTTSTTSSGTTSTTSSGTTTTGTTTTPPPPSDCEAACTDLFLCGLQGDPNGMQLCPGFTPGDLELFLFGGYGVCGCFYTCEALPALVALINPNDCGTTVMTISGALPEFNCVCQFGPGSPECE